MTAPIIPAIPRMTNTIGGTPLDDVFCSVGIAGVSVEGSEADSDCVFSIPSPFESADADSKPTFGFSYFGYIAPP